MSEDKSYYLPAKKIQKAMRISSGSFAVVTGQLKNGTLVAEEWIHCRETFQNHNMEEILFSHAAGASEDIAAFVNAFEEKMGHKKISFFASTNWNRVTWIKPAAFWISKPMRKSLFTALLRAGMRYDLKKDNFDDALYHEKYIAQTKAAVDLFIRGNTWYKGNYRGWYDQFKNLPEESIPKFLTKKPVSTDDLIAYLFAQIGLTEKQVQKKCKKNPTDKEIVDFALGLLRTTREGLVEKIIAEKTSKKGIINFALSELGKTKEEAIEDFKSQKNTQKDTVGKDS